MMLEIARSPQDIAQETVSSAWLETRLKGQDEVRIQSQCFWCHRLGHMKLFKADLLAY